VLCNSGSLGASSGHCGVRFAALLLRLIVTVILYLDAFLARNFALR
jgi:hypothetical protein